MVVCTNSIRKIKNQSVMKTNNTPKEKAVKTYAQKFCKRQHILSTCHAAIAPPLAAPG
jgi:hypothetical protein